MSNDAQDPRTEPSGGEVDGWLGQEVDKDAELVDRVVVVEGGDVAAAEARFEQESEGAQPDAQDTPRP